jgi:cyclic pyranopterin phosphate synthase
MSDGAPDAESGPDFPHVEGGGPRMVDVSAKPEVARRATATGRIALEPETVAAVDAGETRKGDAFAVARVAAVQAVKRTWDEVPLCHQIPVSGIEVDLATEADPPGVRATVAVRTTAPTGPEMEALNGTARALLTVWDVAKDAEKGPEGGYPGTAIEDLHVVEKAKGESGGDGTDGGGSESAGERGNGGEGDGDDG